MIKIQPPYQGIAQSPEVGFGDIRNIDLYSAPGSARLNNSLVKVSGTTVDALIKWIVRDPDTPANVFALDSNGVLYKSANSGDTWTEVSNRSGHGNGLMVKWGYVFVCTDTTIDVMKISDSTWTTGWQTIDSDTLWHPMIVSKNDGIIYGGAGRYIFSIEELTTFAPGTASTYDFTQQRLDLRKDVRVKCLAELGINLMCGTWTGSTLTDFRVADIFPWDRVSPSYGQPIQMTESGVNAMITISNQLYILAGVEGRIYRSDGYNSTPIGEIPQSIADLSAGVYLEPFPGAIMSYKGRLFFGVSGGSAVDGCGVYSLMQTSKGNILTMEHSVSTGNMGATNILQIGALLPISRDECLVGWRDNTTYGIDKADNDAFTPSYRGYFDTPVYDVGSVNSQAKFRQIELQLERDLRANEGVKLRYRLDKTDSYVDIKTVDFATYGAIRSKNIITEIPSDVKVCENIQVQIALTGTTTTPGVKKVTLG